jgi:site-specific DNA-methyltransferase (adenine-specific)/modification methylase
LSKPYKEKWVSDCGRVTLYLGDCLEILPSIKKEVDAVVSDPPYGIGYQHSGNCKKNLYARTEKIHGDERPFDPTHLFSILEYRESLKAFVGTRCVLFGANHYADKIPAGVGQWMAWDKACGLGGADSFVDCEFIWSSAKNSRNIVHHLWKGVMRHGEEQNGAQKRVHVSQKPIAVMVWVMDATRIGLNKTVLDPYMGSGTTGIACLRTGRRFIGIEIDDGHYATAKARIQAELESLKSLKSLRSLKAKDSKDSKDTKDTKQPQTLTNH